MRSLKRMLLAFFLCISHLAVAQNQVRGVVIDQYSKVPLENATLHIQKSGTHTHTDALGKFMLKEVVQGDSIKVSYIGYKNYWLVIGEDSELTIRMQPSTFELDQITITSDVKALSQAANIDLKLNPINSSQEILRKVPGLFIAQHAGGGKAEQIFLRGFDIDHGTDIQITADGLPVNMVSHAHGQGYADLHFLIPETIKSIDFGKGPYYTDKGNFTTAGFVDFQTFDRLDQSSVKVEAGRFNTLRMVGLVDIIQDAEQTDAYLATEYYLTDGPFESPQNFNRLNIFGKYTTQINNNYLTVQGSTFQSKWDASGQIPVRAVESGMISRFGAIDDTEGGQTSRTNLALNYKSQRNENSFIETNAFYTHYDFELYSNFTFFLNDPVNGDQIRQKEERRIYGFNSQYNTSFLLGNRNLEVRAGGGFRYDDINGNELSNTRNRRETLGTTALGDIDEWNGFLYADAQWEVGAFLINPGLRLNYFKFDYVDQLLRNYETQSETQTFAAPNLNVIYSPSTEWQWYVKSGRGFHSNDTRVVVDRAGRDILPAAYGADLGTIFKPMDRLYLNAALWYLYLEQEFVYVGDEGIVEPSGKTRRRGLDVGFTYQLSNFLFADANLNLAEPVGLEEEEGADYIPLAPTITSVGGLAYNHPNGISGSIRYRYIGDRPANEDNSVVAEGYFLTDVVLNYDRQHWGLGFSIENLFDTEWREAQFDTESRLQDEIEPVAEIHYTPGMPFFIKGRVTFKF